MSQVNPSVPRRGFVGRAAAALALALSPSALAAESARREQQDGPDAWLAAMTAPNKLFFDVADFNNGIPQLQVTNFLNTYKNAYGVEDKDANAVVGLWGRATLLAVNDAMWAKYRIGEYLNLPDRTNTPYAKHPWHASVFAAGQDRPASGMEALQARGVKYIVCNNALNLHTNLLAAGRSVEASALGPELRANLVAGVTVVPAMVIAVQRAQKAGFSYLKA